MFTYQELKNKLNDRVSSDAKKGEILTWLNLNIKHQYILEVCNSIVTNQQHGITLSIGQTIPFCFHFIPVVFNFVGDSEELNKICCIKCSPQTTKKCRLCSCSRHEMNTGSLGVLRNSNELEVIEIDAEEAWIFAMLNKSTKHVDAATLQLARDHSIYNMENKMSQLFRYQMVSNHRHSVYNNTPYDKLHTLYKGISEHTISWICVVLIKISKMDNSYKSSISKIDDLIKRFPRHHALNIFGNYLFHSGISTFLCKGEINDENLISMFLMSGSLEASKIPCLLFQLLISISVDGYIIPNTIQWSRLCCATQRTSL